MIPYGCQDINQEDIDAVVDVLRSEWLTQGPRVPKFEQCVASYCGSKYATAVNSATSALHLGCLALGLKAGDLLWTSPITFVASANCALYCGADVDFVDIDPRSYNMSLEALADKLYQADRIGRLPKVVMPVHFAGQSCDMAGIYDLSQRYGFRIIEDASHAIGGSYRGFKIGNCQYSDITVFSFHPVKIVTTAEGGMALTNNCELSEKIALLRSHGITRESYKYIGNVNDGPWYYQQIDLGYNYRMSELQAALGISQIARIDEFVNKRRLIASRYDDALSGLPIGLPWQHEDTSSAYHLYPIRVLDGGSSNRRNILFEYLRSVDIGVNVHYIPVYKQPYYKSLGLNYENLPNAERYYSEGVSLPIFYSLTVDEQNTVISAIKYAVS